MPTTTKANIPGAAVDAAATPAARSLVALADRALNALLYSEYKADNVLDLAAGRYIVVCSQYVNLLLEQAQPRALDAVQGFHVPAAERPDAAAWHDFLASQRAGARAGWMPIATPGELRPGDVIGMRYADPAAHGGATGHVMIVAGVPTPDARWPGSYQVPITDSTSTPHSDDSRASGGDGVGLGEVMLRGVSATLQLAWSSKGIWKLDPVALGRLA